MVMDPIMICLSVLWAIPVLLAMMEYAPHCKDLKTEEKVVIAFILMIGAPFLALGDIIQSLLDTVVQLPEDMC